MLDIKVFDGQITQHFNILEFKCRANGEVLINADVIAHIQRLEKFRTWYNRVIIINSGYRTDAYNKQVNGAPKSQHLLGIATDVALPYEFYTFTKTRQNDFLNNVKNKWQELCKTDGLGGGVGYYDTFFHLDSRKTASFWDLRTGK